MYMLELTQSCLPKNEADFEITNSVMRLRIKTEKVYLNIS